MPTVSQVDVKITGDAHELNEQLDSAKEHLEAFGAIGEGILQGFGLALGQMGFEAVAHGAHHLLEELIEINSAAEVWTAQMTVLTGSTKKASERLEQLAAFAKKAPFELADIREANRLLQVFGGDALAGSAGMKQIGDMASFAQRPITEIADLYGRLHQALESGSSDPRAIMTLRRMGVLSGTAAGELTKLVKAHADGTQVWGAFQKAISRTTGQMDVMMVTYKGRMTNLKDAVHELLHEVGKPFFDGAKEGLIKVIKFLDSGAGQQMQVQIIQMSKLLGDWAAKAGPEFFAKASAGVVRFMDYISSPTGQKTITTIAELLGWMIKGAVISFAWSKMLVLVIEPLMGIGKVVFGFVKTLAVLGANMETVTVMFPALGAAIEILTGPIGWTIAAVTGLWFAWKNNWGHIREFTTEVVAGLIHWYHDHTAQITAFTNWIKEAWGVIVDVLKVAWAFIVMVVSEAWNIISPLVAGAIKGISDILGIFMDLITGNWSKAWEDVKKLLFDVWNSIQSVVARAAQMILHVLSKLFGAMASMPGAMGGAMKATSEFLEGTANTYKDFNAQFDQNQKSAITNEERNQAKRLLGLSKTADAIKKIAGGEKKTGLDKGSTGLNGSGADEAGGKKKKKAEDPNAEVKSKIEELTKALALNGDASELASLKYDLYHGSMKESLPTYKRLAIALQGKATHLAELVAAHDEAKSKLAEYNKVLTLGANATDVQTLAYEMLHGTLKNLAPAEQKHLLLVAKSLETATKSSEAWKSLTEDLKSQMTSYREEINAAKGMDAGTAVFGTLIARAQDWLKIAPLVSKSDKDLVEQMKKMVLGLKELDSGLTKITEDKRMLKMAELTTKAVQSIRAEIDRLKKGLTETLDDRWAIFWDSQRERINRIIELHPNLAQLMVALANIKAEGKELFKAQDTAQYSKNFEEALKRIREEQKKTNEEFGKYIKLSHSAKVAAIEFVNAVRQMTHAQAEQIVKAQEAQDKYAKQVEALKQIGERVSDYVGGLFDHIIHGKMKNLFSEAVDGFKTMLQDMATEYMKSAIKNLFLNILAGKGGGITAPGGGISVTGTAVPKGFANGGFMNSGSNYMVGEEGPEFMTPATNGYLLTNDRVQTMRNAAAATAAPQRNAGYGAAATRGGGEGGPINVHMNISTSDVGGFKRAQSQIMADAFAQATAAARRAGK